MVEMVVDIEDGPLNTNQFFKDYFTPEEQESFDDQFLTISYLIEIITLKSNYKLLELSEKLTFLSHTDRKKQILEHSIFERNQFAKLLVLIRWAKKAAYDTIECQRLLVLQDKTDFCFSTSADMLYNTFLQLHLIRDPIYDVASSLEFVAEATNRTRLSNFENKAHEIPAENKNLLNCQHIDELLRRKLFFDEVLPIEFKRGMKIEYGLAEFTVKNEFQVILKYITDAEEPWTIESFVILVRSKGNLYENIPSYMLDDAQINAIRKIAKNLMYDKVKIEGNNTAELFPLVNLYHFLHSFCLSYQLEILHTQLTFLMTTRWQDQLFVNFDRMRSLINVSYWRCEKKLQSNDFRSSKNFLEFSINEKNLDTKNTKVEAVNNNSVLGFFGDEIGSTKKISVKGFTLNLTNEIISGTQQLNFDECECQINSAEVDAEEILFYITKVKAKEIIQHLFKILKSCKIAPKSSKSIFFAGFNESNIILTDMNYPLMKEENESSPLSEIKLLVQYLPDRLISCSIELRTGNIVLKQFNFQTDLEISYLKELEDKLNLNLDNAVEAFLEFRCKIMLERITLMATKLEFDLVLGLPVEEIDMIVDPETANNENKKINLNRIFLKFKLLENFYLVVDVYGTTADYLSLKDKLKELTTIEISEGCLFKVFLIQIAPLSLENNPKYDIVRSILINNKEQGFEKEVGFNEYFAKITLDFLFRIQEFG
ncbi:Mediator of RNA polymerase II transcription subunit 14, partial [Clydaea vesicula]